MEIAIESKQPFPPLAQQPRRVHTITDRFSMTNTYLINDERILVVDPSSVLNVRLLLAYLKRFLHRPATDIDLIVLTSLHPDHTGGVEFLRQSCSAPVAASIMACRLVESWKGNHNGYDEGREYMMNQGIRETARLKGLVPGRIERPSQSPMFAGIGTLHALEEFTPLYERQIQMVGNWLEDVAGLPNHLDWRVIASPGLTPDSLCLYNPFSYELLSGDTIITRERGSMVVRNGSNRGRLEQTLQTLRSLKVHYLYPGHGRQILARNALTSIRIG